MKKFITSLSLGLLMLGGPSLIAQSTNTPPDTTEKPAGHHAMSADQKKDRQEAMKILGLSHDELKGLSHQERADKIKDAVKKFMADEKAKKDAGTFTAEDQTNVDLVKKVFGHKKAKAASES